MKRLLLLLVLLLPALARAQTIDSLPAATTITDGDLFTLDQAANSTSYTKVSALSFKQYCLQGWTLASGKTLTVNNTITLAATADGETLNIGGGGTLGSAAFDAASAFDASGAASTAQSNAEAYAGNASNLSSGTVAIGRLPTGTTSSTVALGNAPAAAQAAAISAAEANAATIYVSLAGSTGITGNLGAPGSKWLINASTGEATFAGGDFYIDPYADILTDGILEQSGGVFNRYGSPIIDSSSQVYFAEGAGVALDDQGQYWWSNWNYSPTPLADNLNQYHYGDGAVMATYNEIIYADQNAIVIGDGGGDGVVSFANNEFSIARNGAFSADGGAIQSDGSGGLLVEGESVLDNARNLYLNNKLFDNNSSTGTSGQVLESTGSGVQWTSPTTRSVVATDITCATGTTYTNTSWSITLTPGSYDFEVVAYMTTASSTGGINGRFLTTSGDSGFCYFLTGSYNSLSTIYFFNLNSIINFAGVACDAPSNNSGCHASGRLIVGATTTYYWQACQRTATDASNPPILKAGSYISCTRE